MKGACHCGAVRFECTGAVPESVRLCQCSYCRKAGARWWSDPSASLSLRGPLTAYRFGTNTADFLHCTRCGILVAAACRVEESSYAVLNLNNVEGLDAAALPETAHSFDGEEIGDRLARRKSRWMPARRETEA